MSSRTIRIKMTKPELVDTTWREAGESCEAPEGRGVYLAATGFATIAPGTRLSLEAEAYFAELKRDQPKPRPEPPPPIMVEVVAHFGVFIGSWGWLSAGERRAIPESAALEAMAKSVGRISLAPGARLSDEGAAWLAKQPPPPPRYIKREEPKPEEGPMVAVVAKVDCLCGSYVLVPGKGKAPENFVASHLFHRPGELAIAPGAKWSARAEAYYGSLINGHPNSAY